MISLHQTDSYITKESDVPLKKILLWNGASTWGSLKPGRGVFLKVSVRSFSQVVPWSPLNCGLNYPFYNLWFLLLSDFDKINVSPPSGLVSGGLVFYS